MASLNVTLCTRPTSRAALLHVAAEGCITVEKKCAAPKHHVLDIPNIHVMDALKSLKSKGFVTETFNWFVRSRGRLALVAVGSWQV